jgi:hypothetical protein
LALAYGGVLVPASVHPGLLSLPIELALVFGFSWIRAFARLIEMTLKAAIHRSPSADTKKNGGN